MQFEVGAYDVSAHLSCSRLPSVPGELPLAQPHHGCGLRGRAPAVSVRHHQHQVQTGERQTLCCTFVHTRSSLIGSRNSCFYTFRWISLVTQWAGSLFSKLSSSCRDTRDTSLSRSNDNFQSSDRSSGNANVRSIVRSDERACQSLKYFVLFTNILVKTDHSRSMFPAHSLWFSVGLDFGWTEKPQVIGSGLVRNQVISSSYLLIKSPLFSGITAVLTLSTIALDSRTGLPKVHYATALDWFIICSFLYCMASLLEFAGVHYFTKVLNKLNIFDQIYSGLSASCSFLPSGQSDNTLCVCKI